MKVLLLNGSANKNGNTFTALSEIARQLEKNGVESEIMQLGNKPVRGCIACGQCQAKQLGHCVFDDDICNRIVEKLNEADALIVGSPVYYGQPNGAVMAVLQRAFFSGANVQNKPAAAVAICRRGGATAAYQTMNMIFEMMIGLYYFHSKGYIHFDIKPTNFIVDNNGYIKLNDFGLSHKVEELSFMDDIIEGDSRYISKELFEVIDKVSISNIDNRCDVKRFFLLHYRLF